SFHRNRAAAQPPAAYRSKSKWIESFPPLRISAIIAFYSLETLLYTQGQRVSPRLFQIQTGTQAARDSTLKDLHLSAAHWSSARLSLARLGRRCSYSQHLTTKFGLG